MIQVRSNTLPGRLVLAVVLVLGMAFAGLASASAQQTGDLEEAARPGHIHQGSCDDLGEVAYPLTPATINGEDEGAVDLSQAEGSADAYVVYESETEIDEASLDELLAGEFAINFHESEDNIQNYIACGDIGGVVDDDGDLMIGLAELNDSGYTGVAILDGDDDRDDDDGLDVTVVLSPVNSGGAGAEGGAAADNATAEAGDDTATDDGGAAEEITVGMAGRQFSPETIEVPAGTTVTWINDDDIAHTVTSQDDTFDSGNIDPGGTFQFTFDTPGTYEYVCIYHDGMVGTVVVT